MSAAEEDTELRDLLIHTLENNGVLNKIKAELRASVFLALEEQERADHKSPLINESLRQFLSTREGRLAAGLVTDFLQHFHLDFTLAVLQPEACLPNIPDDRALTARDLGLSEAGRKAPLLLELIRQSQHRGAAVNGGERPLPQELPPAQLAEAQAKFEQYDRDKSGEISKDELRALFVDLFPHFHKNMLDRYVNDEFTVTDKDFSNGIDLQEFLGMYRRLFIQCRSVVAQDVSDLLHPCPRLLDGNSDQSNHSPNRLPLSQMNREDPNRLPLSREDPNRLPISQMNREDPNRLPLSQMNREDPNRLPISQMNREDPNRLPISQMSREDPNRLPISQMNREDPNRLPLSQMNREDPNRLPISQMNREDPNRLPISQMNREDPNRLPLSQMNREDPNRLPLSQMNREDPNRLPLSREDPNRLPLNREDPNRLPLNREDPNRLPLSREDPNRLPLSREDPNRLPLSQMNREDPNRLPLSREDPNRLPLSQMIREDPNRLPLSREDPNRLPISREDPNCLAISQMNREDPNRLLLGQMNREDPNRLLLSQMNREDPKLDEDDDLEGDSFFDDPIPKLVKTYGWKEEPSKHNGSLSVHDNLLALKSEQSSLSGAPKLNDAQHNSLKDLKTTSDKMASLDLGAGNEDDYIDDFNSTSQRSDRSEVSIGEDFEEDLSVDDLTGSDHKLDDLTLDNSISHLSDVADYLEDVS